MLQDLGAFLGFWTLMMAAMMLPSVAPAATLYLRVMQASAAAPILAVRMAGFVAGYLGIWAAVGLAAFSLDGGAGWLIDRAPQSVPWIGAGVLALVGLYQLTPLKERCLAHCRSPLSLLMHFGTFSGPLRDLRVGLYHGAYCVGCCWGLMAVLIAVGLMNLPAMAALAGVIFLEKIWRYGKQFGLAVGFALIVLAVVVPSHPTLVPGLSDRGMTTMPSTMP